jgi:hypothetical protein
MDESAGKSEVARLMRHIDLEQEAAERGMHGFASTARHDFINARMQRGGERILQLIEEGRHEEAQALMNTDNWGRDGKQQMKKRRRAGKQTINKEEGESDKISKKEESETKT